MSREGALSDLLSIASPIDIEAYPGEVILPEHIHTAMLEKIDDTSLDQRERSMHFNYRLGHWISGLTLRGPKPSYDEQGNFDSAKVNRLHAWSTSYKPPHLHLHTHPEFNIESVDGLIVNVEPEEITGEMRQQATEITKGTLSLLSRMPSSSEVSRKIRKPLGSVGDIIASQAGYFLSINTDISAAKGIFTNAQDERQKGIRIWGPEMEEEVEEKWGEIFDFTLFETVDFKEIARRTLIVMATALHPIYVSYASDDIQNPRLKRIVLNTARPPGSLK
jgi:hypothetical protein